MISAIVLTKNEEQNIVDCVESLDFCEEIIVIDDNSTDRTVEIVERMGVTLIKHPLEHDFSKQRNFAMEKAKGDWIFFVDADERVPDVLKKEILFRVSEDKYDGFYVKRRDILFGRKLMYGETGNRKFIRLGKKGKGKWEGVVHETWNIKRRVGLLENDLNHYPHQTTREFLSDINQYTDLRARQLYREKKQVKWFDLIIYPKAKFLDNYVLKRGFLDGTPGFVLAVMMSFHSFLVKGKLWLLLHKTKPEKEE